jgi:hypothetical protein
MAKETNQRNTSHGENFYLALLKGSSAKLACQQAQTSHSAFAFYAAPINEIFQMWP